MSGDFVYQNILDALVSFVKTKSETPEKVAAILIREGFPKDNPSTTQDMKTHDHFLYIFTSGTTGLPKALRSFT